MTFKELYDSMFERCNDKIQRDSFKPDPLREGLWSLIVGSRVEWFEFMEAVNKDADPEEILKEVADNLNYLFFIAGKIMGVDRLER